MSLPNYRGEHPTFTGPQTVAREGDYDVLLVADNWNRPFVTHYYVQKRGKDWTRRGGFDTLEEAVEYVRSQESE